MKNKSLMIPAGMFLALFTLYFFGAMTTVPGGDSGMFIGASFSGGVAQPPGYPLITIFYKLLHLIPGDSTHLINLSSGFFNSLACVCLYFLFKSILGCPFNSLVISSLFGVLPLIFRYGVVAEVFALNNFLIAATLLISYKFQETKNLKIAWLGVFVMGLAMSNHHTFAFVGLPLVLWLIVNNKEFKSPKVLITLFAFGLIGLSPYLYLLFSSASSGPITWGDTATWDGFWHHFLRRDFGTFKLTAKGSGGFFLNLWAFISSLPAESFLIFLLFPFYWMIKKLKSYTKNSFPHLIIAILIFYIGLFFNLANINLSNPLFKEVFMRFWQLPLILLTILSAYGLHEFNQKYPEHSKKMFYLLVCLLISRATLSIKNHGRRGLTIFEDYASIMLKSLPQGAVLIANGDLQVNILRYMQTVKSVRKDVVILPIPIMDLPWYKAVHKKAYPNFKLPAGNYHSSDKAGSYQMLDLAIVNPGKKYFMLQVNEFVQTNVRSDLSLLKKFQWVPYGFLFSLEPKGISILGKQVIKDHNWAQGQFNPESYKRMEKGSWEELVTDAIFWNSERFHMIYHTRQLKNKKKDFSHRLSLANHIEKLREKFSPLPPEFLKNLGLLYYSSIASGRSGLGKKLTSAWREYYNQLENKTTKEAAEIKKAIDHFGKHK